MKEAKLFKNGQSQAVRLPRQYRLPGKSVFVRKLGRAVVLIPKDRPWDLLMEASSRFTSDFMADREQGVHERDDLIK